MEPKTIGELTQSMKTIPTRDCVACGKTFEKKPENSRADWARKHTHCSIACAKKGNKNRLGISYPAWNKGKPGPRGQANANWKGGVTPLNQVIRTSLEYKLWREAVFVRDNYTCQICQIRGGDVHADHIKKFADFPELRMAIDNGRTLCVPCHRQTDTYGNRKPKI